MIELCCMGYIVVTSSENKSGFLSMQFEFSVPLQFTVLYVQGC